MATRLERLIVRLKIKGVRNSGKAQEISKNATTFCDYCRAIDLEQLSKEAPDGSSQTGLLHHASYKDLCKSAKRGCALCSLIQEYGRSRRVSERDASSSARRIYCSAIDWSGRDGSLLFNSLNWEQPFKGGLSTSLNIFVSKDDPLAQIVPMRSLSKDAGADTCYDVMTTWLNNCSETHAACQKAHLKLEKKLPTRVIEVNFGGEPRLIESDGKSGEWVALSYCWGSSRHYTTTTKNLVEHYGRICISDLPNTVQDAVIITRRLGYQYLWVDSLCIIQDSKEDWEIEAMKMSNVYGDASLTLAAEAAEDSGSGIFASTNRNRHQIREYPLAVRTRFPKHNIEGRVNFRPAMKRPGKGKNPLSKRAWTLQEGLLSPRVLHFAEDQIYWRCLEEELVETSPEWYGHTERWEPSATATRGLHRLIESEKFSLAIWYDIVDDFAQRNLSYQKDRLVALSAVAKQAAKSMGLPPHSYKAGLWESDLYRGLLWSNQGSSSNRMYCVPQDEYVAPSWSWASISTTYMIQFGHTYIYGHVKNGARLIHEIADIQEVCTETVNHESFGLVQRGFMKIVGPCFETCQCNIPNGFLDCHEESLSFEESKEGLSYAEFGSDCPTAGIDEPKKRVLILRGSSGTEYLRRVYPEGLETHSTILLLQIATWQAVHDMARVWVLILRSTGGLNEYGRIGCSWFNITDDRLRHDWTEKEITIV